SVSGGLHGNPPDLADLVDGDVKHHCDFRQVYASLLDDWLQTPSKSVLGRSYETLKIFAKS
ncbi:MAG: hypothetical protein WEB60_02570, partial [Terrimicrobiaceae bacterium]